MKAQKVLSLFDGISGARMALERIGIPIEKYYASEVNPWALSISEYNFPDNINLGDVNNVRGADLGHVDILSAGFPCQSFSRVGNKLNFDDPRGQLFFQALRILRELQEINPDIKFLFENVRMKAEIADKISELLGVNYVKLDSGDFSSQRRPRFYWTNVPILPYKPSTSVLKDVLEEDTPPIVFSNVYGGFGESDVRVHEDKSPTIRTAAGGGHIPYVLDKYRLSETAQKYMEGDYCGKERYSKYPNPLEGKAGCLTANMFKGVPFGVIKELCRRLTPVECERLQTLEDGSTSKAIVKGKVVDVSDTQRYNVIGNGFTIETVAHIFKGLK